MPSSPVYIVTGGAGFIGANLVAALVAREADAHVVVIDDFRKGSYANIVEAFRRKGLGPFRGSVTAQSVSDLDWDQAVEALSPTAVFHLGAITDTLEFDERTMFAANSEPWVEILSACIGSETPLVYASSGATYGSPSQGDDRIPFPESAAGEPNNVYGFSKWLMDAEVFRLFDERRAAGTALPHVVGLRYFNVFGPGEARKGKMASMAYHLTQQMLRGERPRIFKQGEHARDQVFVDDVVDCTMTAAGVGSNSDPVPGVYNAGSGQTTTFNQIVEAINGALGTNLEPDYIDMPEAMVPTYQHYTCADMSETAKALGWKPAHDPFEATRAYASLLRDEAARNAPAEA